VISWNGKILISEVVALRPVHNETELIFRITDGDEGAFSELFLAYHNQIGAFVNTIVDSKEMVEEIVQDVFLKVWLDRHSLPAVQKFTSYLFILTRNYALNAIRKKINQERWQHEYLNTTRDVVLTEDASPDDDYLSLLESAMEHLPPQQRKVFELRKDGFKNPEIAEQLGLTVDSVKKYQQLALKSVSEFVKMRAIVSLTFFAFISLTKI
jgi:RNA polymerase sigma-70 factor (family 1)